MVQDHVLHHVATSVMIIKHLLYLPVIISILLLSSLSYFNQQSVVPLASRLKDLGVRLILAAVGNKVDRGKLRPLVEADEDIVESNSFSSLLLKSNYVLKRVCIEPGK